MEQQMIPTGYKQTEVGVIPEDWGVNSISEFCSYQNGKAQEQFFNPHGGYKVISIGNYSEFGRYIDTRSYIDKSLKKEIGRFVLDKDDLAMILNDKTAIGTIIGRVILIDADDTYVMNQRTMRLTPNGCVISQYLHFLVNSDFVHKRIVGMAKPGTQIYVNTDDILDFKLPLPTSNEEQTAIATALSDTDALINELEKLIQKKQAIKTATMQQLLTGLTRLPQFALREDGTPKGMKDSELGEIPEDWEVKKFTDVTNVITCGIAATPTYVSENSGYPFLSSTNVKSGQVVWKNYKYIAEELHNQLYRNNPPLIGDVLYSRVGTIGEAAVVEDNFEFSIYVSLTLIKPQRALLNSYYLMHLLNSVPYKNRAKEQVYLGGGVGNLNVDVVRNYPVIVPPLEEQTLIATVLSDMDTVLVK